MSSFINIGMVYDENNNIKLENELKNIINYLLVNNGYIKYIKYSNDEYGNQWVENNHFDLQKKEQIPYLLANKYFGELAIICDIIGINQINIIITSKKINKNSFGILFDIQEIELIKSTSKKSIDYITNEIINLIIKLYSKSQFDYAFCDNEAMIEYSPLEFNLLSSEIYSITIFPNKKKKDSFKIIKSDWNIDGLTSR